MRMSHSPPKHTAMTIYRVNSVIYTSHLHGLSLIASKVVVGIILPL